MSMQRTSTIPDAIQRHVERVTSVQTQRNVLSIDSDIRTPEMSVEKRGFRWSKPALILTDELSNAVECL